MDDVKRAELALQRARARENEAARQRYLDKLAAEKAERAEAKAKVDEAARLKAEADLKRECGYRFLNGGGTPQEFEKQWPSIRLERLKQLAAGTGAPSFVDEIVRKKRSSGVYGNLG